MELESALGESTWARIKLEISVDERICKPPKLRPIIHAYEEKLDAQILTYSLEEIFAVSFSKLYYVYNF